MNSRACPGQNELKERAVLIKATLVDACPQWSDFSEKLVGRPLACSIVIVVLYEVGVLHTPSIPSNNVISTG